MKKHKQRIAIAQPLFECFSELKDPRVVGRTDHKLIDIIAISICAIISGAKFWNQVALFGRTREKWLKQFLELPNGIPSDDTFLRVFAAIDPEAFQASFIKWARKVEQITSGKIIAIDGKTLRKSFCEAKNQEAIPIVNAFAVENGITLGSIKVPDKSNEIKGIPKLLNMLKLTGCIVTLDAMGTQKGIAKLIRLKRADYVLALKKNQGKLYKKVSKLFEVSEKLNYTSMVYKVDSTFEYDRTRIERREYRILPMMYLNGFKKDWQDINTFIEVKSCIETPKGFSTEVRYYISSLTLKEYKKITRAIRQHWGIETKLHWKLDVAMKEDDCRVYSRWAAENFSALRKIALYYLEKDTSLKAGIQVKQFNAAINETYLAGILGLSIAI
jgi:predicted transposase YbfD/YdcC